jgi:hypothetical protein
MNYIDPYNSLSPGGRELERGGGEIHPHRDPLFKNRSCPIYWRAPSVIARNRSDEAIWVGR